MAPQFGLGKSSFPACPVTQFNHLCQFWSDLPHQAHPQLLLTSAKKHSNTECVKCQTTQGKREGVGIKTHKK